MGQYTFYAAKQAHKSRREERDAKRAAIRAAAHAADLYLHEYNELNESTTPAWQASASGLAHPPPVHSVHSSPRATLLEHAHGSAVQSHFVTCTDTTSLADQVHVWLIEIN